MRDVEEKAASPWEGAEKRCVRQVSVCARSSEKTLGKHGICDNSPESPALRVVRPIEAGCF